MEVIGVGLTALGSAIAAIAGWTGFTVIIGTAAITFLIYTDKIPMEKIEQFLENRKRKKY